MRIDDTTERQTLDSDEFGRSYWLLFGFGGGAFVAIAVALAVMIMATPAPVFATDPTLPASGASSVTVIGTEFAFESNDLLLSVGAEVTFDNQGLVVHNIEVEGVAGFKVEAQPGQQVSGNLNVDPGEYLIFCSIPGHREAGMEGTLVVATG